MKWAIEIVDPLTSAGLDPNYGWLNRHERSLGYEETGFDLARFMSRNIAKKIRIEIHVVSQDTTKRVWFFPIVRLGTTKVRGLSVSHHFPWNTRHEALRDVPFEIFKDRFHDGWSEAFCYFRDRMGAEQFDRTVIHNMTEPLAPFETTSDGLSHEIERLIGPMAETIIFLTMTYGDP